MGIGSSLSGINFSGLGSGLDTNSIVSQLIQIESIPLRRMQQQQAQLQARLDLFSRFRTQINGFKATASVLNSEQAFNPISATSSNTEVATISGSTAATASIYSLAVSKLAQSHKIASIGQASATEALDQSGTFVVNGKAITVSSTDSLTQIAQKINNASAGVTASVIDGGAGQAFLTISSSKTGLSGKVQIADVGGGTVLQSIGIVSGSASIRQPITNGAASFKFSSSTSALGTLMNGGSLPNGSVTIGAGTVSIDLQNDSLQTIVNKINDPVNGTGVTATLKTETKDGVTSHWIEISGASTPTLVDANGILEGLGLLQRGYGNQMIAAQNAEYSLDGVNLTSETNTITTAIPGATFTLLKANATTPETATLSLSRDTSEIKKNVKAFADAYNSLVDFIRQNSQFDKDTFASGPLFGDATVQQVESILSSMLLSTVGNLGSSYDNLTTLGFSFDAQGKLTVDDAKLDAAINANPTAVGNLLRTTGSGSVTGLNFISAGSKAKATTGAGYEINITRLATKASYQAETWSGLVTFSGNLFGSQSYQITLPDDIDEAVAKINADPTLKDSVVAINWAGELRVLSKKYGASGNFTMDGVTGEGFDGADIEGTINGEPATGSGQFLTGNANNANTEGLQIQYTGTSLGSVGFVRVNKGVASLVHDFSEGIMFANTGLLSANDVSIQNQIDDVKSSITSLQSRISLREQTLRQQFLAMEQAVSRLQQQQQRLSAMSTRQ